MNLLVSQEHIFPSIFIAKTVDLTLTLKPNEKGVCGAIGKLSIGNPYYNQVLKGATEKLKSTNVNNGGSLDNELAYHIKDFFSGFNGKMVVGRVLGEDSKTKVLKVQKDATNSTFSFDDTEEINIFGADNIKDFEDTTSSSSEIIELVVNACPSEKTTVQVVNEDDYLTVTIKNDVGKEIYKVSGGASFDSIDDSGVNDYIGNKSDNKILTIKVDKANTDYESNFSITKTFDNGLITDTGDKNYTIALDNLKGDIEKCDYAITGGLTDEAIIQKLRAITFEAKVLLAVDIKGKTIKEANDFRISLNMNEEDCCFIWNRIKNKFDAGNLSIGLSGWFVGQCIKKNMSKMIKDVENRADSVAGVDYEIPRKPAENLKTLTNDEKTNLTKYRINTVSYLDGKLIIGDVLSGNPKNVALRLFPVSEANHFINRYIARIMAVKLFKNLGEAKSFIDNEVRKLFDRCQRNGYFSGNVDVPYTYTVSDKDSDTIVVDYQYVPEGIMRKGIVSGTLVKKIGD